MCGVLVWDDSSTYLSTRSLTGGSRFSGLSTEYSTCFGLSMVLFSLDCLTVLSLFLYGISGTSCRGSCLVPLHNSYVMGE